VDSEGDIDVRLWAAVVRDAVSFSRNPYQVPFSIRDKTTDITTILLLESQVKLEFYSF